MPEFRESEISGTLGKKACAQFQALGTGSLRFARGRYDKLPIQSDRNLL
jgi:hypothetical protein